MSELAGLFTAERVAVVGATDREGSIGRALLENLAEFEGSILPVNPNRDTVLGQRCFENLRNTPDSAAIDLAIVIVPAEHVGDIVREAGELGISNIIVISAGFSERGPAGERMERDLIATADKYELNLVGPNCVGVINTATGLNATFLGSSPQEGSISLISQSGAFISAALGWATHHGIGFRNVVSLGNEAVLDEVDFIEEWGSDPETDVILAYLEDIETGRAFIETARDVTAETPVVVLKSGRTEAGAEAAASHTGSIAGRDVAYDAAFHQAGVLRAQSIEDIFDIGRILDGQPALGGDRIAVVTNGGGPGVLATDAIETSALSVAEFTPTVRANLAEELPEQVAITNPLDLIGDADLDRYRRALRTVLDANSVDGLVVLSVPTAIFDYGELATCIGDLQSQYEKPVVACLMGGPEADRATETLETYGIPNYFDPSRAVTGLDALAAYNEITSRDYEPTREFDVDSPRARTILSQSVERETDRLSVEAMELLDAYGIPIPAGELVENAAAAESIAQSLGGPVVLKIASPDILHKSDIGGVAVDVDVEDVTATYERLVERATEHNPDAEILGVRVEEYVELDDSTETIVGVSHDPQFGHLIMFGLGGIFVEIFEDTAFRIAPVNKRDAREMTADIQAAPMLRGARGRPNADLDSVVETLQRVSQLVVDFPAIRELDVNPLVVGPDGVCAVDLRLSVDREAFTAMDND